MKENEAIISDLYALRSGLSVISEQKDKTQEIKEATDAKTAPVAQELCANMLKYYSEETWRGYHKLFVKSSESAHDEQAAIVPNVDAAFSAKEERQKYEWGKEPGKHPVYGRDYETNRKFMQKYGKIHRTYLTESMRSGEFDRTVQEYYKKADEKISNKERALKLWKGKTLLSLIPIFLGLIVIIVCAAVFSSNAIVLGVGCAVGSVLILLGSILLILRWKGYRRRQTDHDTLTSTKEFVKTETKELHEKFSEMEAYEQEANREIKPYKETSDALYQVLESTYSNLLDSRDWPYVDIIIYYFETGRARDMHEALLLLDKERHTREIVGAIQEAATMICRSIERGFASMASAMRAGFASLQQSINSGFARMNAIGAAQLQATQLEAALQAKASVTSEQLMNDVHFMRAKLYY